MGRQVLGAKKGGRVEGVGWGRGGVGGERGRGKGGSNRFWERKAGKCVKCAYRRRNSPPAASTPLRAGSASSMKNKMRGPAPPASSLARVFWGCKRREKGRFHLRLIQHAARSADILNHATNILGPSEVGSLHFVRRLLEPASNVDLCSFGLGDFQRSFCGASRTLPWLLVKCRPTIKAKKLWKIRRPALRCASCTLQAIAHELASAGTRRGFTIV